MKINKKCIITLLGIVIASPIAINSSISSASVFTRIDLLPVEIILITLLDQLHKTQK